MGYKHKFYRNSQTDPAHVNKQEGKRQALELRMQGTDMTYAAIGERLGVSAMCAWRWVSEALSEIKFKNQEMALELRTINTQRLELAMAQILAKIDEGKAKTADYNVLVKLIQTENKMWGVSEPDRVDVNVNIKAMSVEEKMALVEDLMRQGQSRRIASSSGKPPSESQSTPQWKVASDAPDLSDVVDVKAEIVQ